MRSLSNDGGDEQLKADLLDFAARFVDRDRIGNHYRHLGERQRRTYFADGKAMQLKKLFYALRPAAALRWLRTHPDAAIAPMHFPTLIMECEPPDDVLNWSRDLIARKAVTRELGVTALPRPIESFVDEEFALARETFPEKVAAPPPAARAAAEALFRASVRRLAPT